MVGDSLEDIETANAAGTASCLIAGKQAEPGGALWAGGVGCGGQPRRR